MMDKRNRVMLAVAAIIGLPVIGAATVLIGNNTGTAAQRCDRFWLSRAASDECHQRLADDASDREMRYSADLQRQIDDRQRSIDATQARIREADRMMGELQSSRR